MNEAKLKRILACGFTVVIFANMFFFTPYVNWMHKFALFQVPAFSYSGADARNIQAAAYCVRQGFPLYGENACMTAAEPVTRVHPEANVPVLNYPSIWVRVYGLFHDDSEKFFVGFWRLNALLLALGLAALCYRYNVAALPLLLFSPVALLAVERGNIDATTFFFTFAPLLLFARSLRVQSFAVGFAGALKIFPAVGWLAFARRRPPFVAAGAALGAVLALPLLIMSLLDLRAMLEGTTRGVDGSFGLASLMHAPLLEYHPTLAFVLTCVAGLAVIGSGVATYRSRATRAELEADLVALEPVDRTVLLVSTTIFLATFLLFTSWAYRLIFVAPALLVLSKGRSVLAQVACLNVVAVLWLPFAPWGWQWLNLACYPLAAVLAGVLAVTLDVVTRERG